MTVHNEELEKAPLLEQDEAEYHMQKNKAIFITRSLALSTLTLTLFTCFFYLLLASYPNSHPPAHHDNFIVASFSGEYKSTLSRYAVSYISPTYFQEDRGTCWDFATVGLLEMSYRKNGYERGFLKPNEGVVFSKQAYGVAVIEACQNKNGPRGVCDSVGDGVQYNSTDGGEIFWIYYLQEFLSDKILPVSVCPYNPEPDPKKDVSCPGMSEAVNLNPIRFAIAKMDTLYNIPEIKARLVSTGNALGWSQPVPDVYMYVPLEGNQAPTVPGVDVVSCPTNFRQSRCMRFYVPSYNMKGEYLMGDEFFAEGGHAEVLVGYNDDYVDLAGNRGGFIIKNSWHDRIYPLPRGARGSHSIRFLMQEISDWDERSICANANDPRNWLSCVDAPTGPRRASPGTILEEKEDYDLNACLDQDFMKQTVLNQLQPMEFVCVDKRMCKVNSRFFYLSTMPGPHSSSQVCFVELEEKSSKGKKFCLPYMPLDVVPQFIQADPSIPLPDSEECGYYFMSYHVAEQLASQLGSFFATDLSVIWDDSSYYYNRGAYPQYSYALFENSTFHLNPPKFTGPKPSI